MLFIKSLLIFSIFLSQINCSFYNLPQIQDQKVDNIVDQFVRELIHLVMNFTNRFENLTLTEQCKRKLKNSFFIMDKPNHKQEETILAYYYYTKLLLDSSTNINDLSSYQNCLYSDHDYDFSNVQDKKFLPMDPLFVTIFIDHRKEQLEHFRNNNDTISYLVGICFIEGCSDDDIKLLSSSIFDLLNIRDLKENFEIYTVNDNNSEDKFLDTFLKFIPINIIIIHIIIVFFHSFFVFLYKVIKPILCCERKKNRTIEIKFDEEDELNDNLKNKNFGNNNQTQSQNQQQKFKNYFNALFNVQNNFEFLLISESKEEIRSDNSLSYMNGIKGISLITTIFGFVFLDLYNTPIIEKSLDNFYEISSNPAFFIFYFGVKFAPKLLLCSSGFSLFFKFMCFLDDKTEVERELKRVNTIQQQLENDKKEKITDNNENVNKTNENIKTNNIEISEKNKSAENIKPKNIKNIGMQSEDKGNKDSSSNSNSSNSQSMSKKKRIYQKNIPVKYYFWFLTNQINKYILYLLLIFFILFHYMVLAN